MLIYKIFRRVEWNALQAEGQFAGSVDDLRDGFIHLSTQDQLQGTLDKHFAGCADLVIATVCVAQDPDLKWEVSRGGAEFPHLYRALTKADIMSFETR